MGYRELHRMEIEEVVRRWQACESQRAKLVPRGWRARRSRSTWPRESAAGVSATGPPPSETILVELRRLGVVATHPVHRLARQMAILVPLQRSCAPHSAGPTLPGDRKTGNAAFTFRNSAGKTRGLASKACRRLPYPLTPELVQGVRVDGQAGRND